MIQAERVCREVRGYIVENFLYGRGGELADGDSLLEKGLIDSTGVLELVELIESRYGIKVEDDELVPDNLDSVSALTGFVERKLKRGAQ